MEFIICSANLVFVVEPKVNRLWKTKGLVHSIFMKRISSTEYTEWQRQLSGELSIMIEKLAQSGVPSRTKLWCTHHESAEYTPPISTLPLYVFCDITYDDTCNYYVYNVHLHEYMCTVLIFFSNLSMANDSDLIGGYMRKLLARYDSIRWVELRYTDKKRKLIFPHILGNSEWSSCKVI